MPTVNSKVHQGGNPHYKIQLKLHNCKDDFYVPIEGKWCQRNREPAT